MFRLIGALVFVVTSVSVYCSSLEASEDTDFIKFEQDVAININKAFPSQGRNKFKIFQGKNFIYAVEPSAFNGKKLQVIYDNAAMMIHEAAHLVSYYSGMKISKAPENAAEIIFVFSNNFSESMVGTFRGAMDVYTDSGVDEYIKNFKYDGSGCFTKIKASGFEILGAINFIEADLSSRDMRRCIMLSMARSVGFVRNFRNKDIYSLVSEDNPAIDFTDFDKRVLNYIYE